MTVDPFDTGVVTVMFTDVEGSTDLTRRLGDEAARRTIENHRRIVREQLATHDGREIDSIGDGFMLTFLSTRRAIACAIAIQKALAEHAREHPDEEVKLRIGLNVGEVLERGGHPFGAAVNATQRVGSHAKGGEIFVSEPVRHLAGTVPDVTFRDRGRFTLKGFSERWRLYEVVYAPAKEKAPPKPKAKPVAGRRRQLLLGALGAGGVVVALAAFLVLRGGTETLDRVNANAVGIIEPGSGDIVGEVRVGKNPVDIAFGEEPRRLWVANLDVGTISEIDPESRTLVDTFNAGETPTSIAAGEKYVWVANQFADKLSRFDPAADDVGDTVEDLLGPTDVAAGFGAVWVATETDKTVVRIDPETGAREKVADGNAVALGQNAVWIAFENKLTRFDPATRKRAGQPLTLRFPASQLAVGEDGTVWVTHTSDDAVTRVNPDGTSLTIEDVGNDPTGVAVGEGSAWIASSLGRALVEIGAKSSKVDRQIPLGSSPAAVVVADGHVWVTTRAAA